ncbi:MAG: hypothetical protein IPM74_04230 [Crocinitomicaceae bacterium]|nr:hypothetical protein [Crocinitomicaceae bacterium]MBK8925116.1 hypothetical protein [Crocinitomicaceae bacterium]
MRVPISKTFTLDELKSKLETEMGDVVCSFRSPKILVVKDKSSSAAALVLLRSNRALVNEGFASMGAQMVFALSLVLLGILIPFLIYAIAFLPKQKAIRNKVADYIKTNYGTAEVV